MPEIPYKTIKRSDSYFMYTSFENNKVLNELVKLKPSNINTYHEAIEDMIFLDARPLVLHIQYFFMDELRKLIEKDKIAEVNDYLTKNPDLVNHPILIDMHPEEYRISYPLDYCKSEIMKELLSHDFKEANNFFSGYITDDEDSDEESDLPSTGLELSHEDVPTIGEAPGI